MTTFYTFPWAVRLLITLLLGICILAQTLALVFNFYRLRITLPRVFENLLEVAILCEILVFSLLHGQVVNGFDNGFVVQSGYIATRISVFLFISILAIIVLFFTKKLHPLIVIPAAIVTLPITENMLGHTYPSLFIMALLLFLIRSIVISVSSVASIKTSISALSVINAIDSLHTGVLFSESDGYTLLSNDQMRSFMLATSGKIFRSAIKFYDTLISGKFDLRYETAELDGQIVYLLPDGTAWMLTKTEMVFGRKTYIHISVADVSELWSLTAKLQLQVKELSSKSDEIKRTIANLHILSKQWEIENAKMRAHDILGQRLTVLLRLIQNEDKPDYDLLASMSKGLLEELKAEQSETGPYDELRSIQQIFAAIGVEIKFEGRLPQNNKQACLFVDIIREGSTNAVRHGFATQINIKTEPTEDTYNLTITNNGYTTTTPIAQGSGINIIRKKVGAQGGNLHIVHHPKFTLSVVLPGGNKYE